MLNDLVISIKTNADKCINKKLSNEYTKHYITKSVKKTANIRNKTRNKFKKHDSKKKFVAYQRAKTECRKAIGKAK